jgi:TonB family protein
MGDVRISASPEGESMYKSFRFAITLAMLLSFGVLASAEIRVATDDAMKAATKKTAPDYPPIAKQLRVAGKVQVDVTIDADGNVENVKVVAGNAMLTQSVIAAVKKWKFTPFLQDGNPTKAVAALEFDFKM